MAQPTQGLSSSASASLASRPIDQDSPTGIAKKKLKKSVDENKEKEKENNVKVNKDKDDDHNKDQKKNKDGSEVPKEKKKKAGKPRSATHDGVESSIISTQGNWDSKSANNYHKVDQFYWSHEHNNWFSSTSGPPPPSGGAGETDEVNKYDVDIWDGNSAEQAQGKSDSNLTEEKEEVNVSKNSLTFVTWNVWFGYRTEDVAALKPRLTGLFEIIAKLEPDFVCLQEVTHPISVILRLHPYFQQKGYWMSDPSLIKDTAYGIMMISKLPIIELCQITLPTKLGRYCLLAKTRLNDEIIGVLTCHWESLDQNVEFRRKQWQIIYSVMEGEEELPGNKSSASSPNKTKIDHAFIMGDCNFANQKERKELIIKRYEDLWKNFNKKKRKSKKKTPKSERIDKSSDATEEQEKSKDVSKKDKDKNGKDSKRSKKDGANKNDPKGFTFDPERNRMLKKIIESGNETVWKRERVDVILCKSKKWKSEHVQLLGTEPLAGVKQLVHQKKKSTADGQDSATTAYDEVYPSDHFGLHGRYVWKKDGAGIGVDSPKLTK